MRTFLLLLACSLLYSCATNPASSPIEIDGLIFNNESPSDINQIRLSVESTHNFIACENIVVGGICSTIFPARSFSGQKVTVAWSTAHRDFLVEDAEISGQSLIEPGQHVLVNVVIVGNGSLSIALINR